MVTMCPGAYAEDVVYIVSEEDFWLPLNGGRPPFDEV
jgi:hypothetical protein